MIYKHFNDKKINIYLGVELYIHIFITQCNYSHALEKKNNIANVWGYFWTFTFLYTVITA
jgi:hypothetical protein